MENIEFMTDNNYFEYARHRAKKQLKLINAVSSSNYEFHLARLAIDGSESTYFETHQAGYSFW